MAGLAGFMRAAALYNHIAAYVRNVVATAELGIDMAELAEDVIKEPRITAARQLAGYGYFREAVPMIGTKCSWSEGERRIKTPINIHLAGYRDVAWIDPNRLAVASEREVAFDLETLNAKHREVVEQRLHVMRDLRHKLTTLKCVINRCHTIGEWCGFATVEYMHLVPPDFKSYSDYGERKKMGPALQERLANNSIDPAPAYAVLHIAMAGWMQLGDTGTPKTPALDVNPAVYNFVSNT